MSNHKNPWLFALLLLCVLVGPSAGQTTLNQSIDELARQIVEKAAKSQKTKVAVIPFRELDGRATVLGTYLAEELTTSLFDAGTLEIIERTMLNEVLAELKLGQSGAIDSDTAKEVGKLSGVEAIVTGSITDLQSFVALNCRLIYTETGRVFAAARTKVVKDDNLRKLMGRTMPSGAQTTPPTKEPETEQTKEKPPPSFETESYLLSADSFKIRGGSATLTVTLKGMAPEIVHFGMVDCYLLDESGSRWEQEGTDTGGIAFKGWYGGGREIIPGTRIRSRLTFTREKHSTGGGGRGGVRISGETIGGDREASTGPAGKFTFIGEEFQPTRKRKIILRGLESD